MLMRQIDTFKTKKKQTKISDTDKFKLKKLSNNLKDNFKNKINGFTDESQFTDIEKLINILNSSKYLTQEDFNYLQQLIIDKKQDIIEYQQMKQRIESTDFIFN